MTLNKNIATAPPALTRRGFIKAGAAAAGAAALPVGERVAPAAPRGKLNFLYLIADQLRLDAIAAHGDSHVHTPNLDRLIARGVTFMESHSTNPVCSPARSSLMTGRMPCETGVISNNRAIHQDVPNIGQWFRQHGYDTVHCGKWHLPGGYPTEIPGFHILPVGMGQGDLSDVIVSRNCEAFLRTRSREKPFVLVASLMQPHDICYWCIYPQRLVPAKMPFPELADKLPPLPPNHKSRPRAPERLDRLQYKQFNDEQWRYYIYTYYRQVEMLDADVGRILDALEDSGEADRTIVVLTSDHGEGGGRHSHVQKWYPYEESVKVPLVFSCPGTIAEAHRDTQHLVSGIDIMNTLCDYAGIQPPPHLPGRSLRPLLEGRKAEWREFVVSGHHLIDNQETAGFMVRTARYKFVKYKDDPVEQLFDLKSDPWEMKNIYDDPEVADIVQDHQKLLADWNAKLRGIPPTPDRTPRRPNRPRAKKG